jgi:hypothetical protein
VKSSEVPPTICPSCGKRLDGATDPLTKATPKEGDVSVCAYCQNIAVFRADQTLRAMTAREWAEMPATCRKQLEAIQLAIDQFPPPGG